MSQQVETPSMESTVLPDLGRWKVKRNIHLWIIGIVVVVLAIFGFMEANREQSPDEAIIAARQAAKQKELNNLNQTDKPPAKEDLDRVFRQQQEEANKRKGAQREEQEATPPASAQLPPNLANGQMNLPKIPPGTPLPPNAGGLPTPQQMQQGQQNPEVLAAQKREEQIVSAPIMALDNGSRATSAASAGRSSGNSLQNMQQQLAEERQRREAEMRTERDQTLKQTLAATQAVTGGGIGGLGGSMGRSAAVGGGSDQMFANGMANRDSTKDVLRPIPSRGAFTLMQGASISAVLETQINSDLIGDIRARVTMNVYDSASGAALLIPKGSVLVGKYNSDVRIGQEKVFAAFSRLIYPSGASVDINGMKAAEGSGESGIGDEVDNHFWKMFGANFLIAGLAQLVQKDPQNVTIVNTGTGGGGSGIATATGQILSDTTRTINERNRVIQPTILAYKGHKFIVMVNKDMILPPYQTGTKQ